MPTEHPPGFAEIEYASRLAAESDEWLPFITKVLKLNQWMVPAIQEVVRQQRWRTAPNPVGYIRTAAHREANRLGLHQDSHKHSEDRRCPCGAMTKAKAKERGHACVYAGYDAGAIADINLPASAWRGEDSSTSAKKGAYHAAHDQFIEDATAAACISDDDDDQEVIEYDDETGVMYAGEPNLKYVPNHLIKRIEPMAKRFADDGEGRALLEYFRNLPAGYTEDGMMVVDWQKVASLLPIKAEAKSIVGTVLEMRFHLKLKFAEICEYPNWFTGLKLKEEQRRRRLQAAWKMIDRHMDDIKKIFRSPASPPAKADPEPEPEMKFIGTPPYYRRVALRPPLKSPSAK
jgi:hypothetical protein